METVQPTNIDQKQRIERAYVAANYYSTRLKILLSNKQNFGLRETFEEFRYAFIGLHRMIRYKDRFDPNLISRMENWEKVCTGYGTLSKTFYARTLGLWDDYSKYIVMTLKVIEK